MNSDILNSIASWLQMDDALACCCVCKAWNQALNCGAAAPVFWKDLCETIHPGATKSVLEVRCGNPMGYKELALFLSYRDPPNQQLEPRSTTPSYTSSVGLDNYYAVVDLYRRVVTPDGKQRIITLGSFTIDGDLYLAETTGIVLRGANRYALTPEFATLNETDLVSFRKEPIARETMHPVGFCARDILGKDNSELNVRVRLCRKDSGKSLVIQHTDIQNERDDDDDDDEWWGDNEVDCSFMDDRYQLNPDPSTGAGLMLSGIMRNDELKRIVVRSVLTISIRTSEDHLGFLSSDPDEIEYDERNDVITQNMDVLRAIPSFECEIVHFGVALFGTTSYSCDCCDHPTYNFDGEKLQILLEGLRWY